MIAAAQDESGIAPALICADDLASWPLAAVPGAVLVLERVSCFVDRGSATMHLIITRNNIIAIFAP